jgi:hypothetical protein
MEDIEKLLDAKYDQLWKEVTFKLKALVWLKEKCNNTESFHSLYYDNVETIDTITRMYLDYKLRHSELDLPAKWFVSFYPGYIQVDCNAYIPKNLENNPFN